MLGCIMWNAYSFIFLFLIITVLSVWEFYSLAEKAGAAPQKYLGLLLATGLFLSIVFFMNTIGGCFAGEIPNNVISISLVSIFLIFPIELYRKRTNPFANIAWTLLGIIYGALPYSLFVFIGFKTSNPDIHQYHAYIILGYLFILWSSDVGAYLIGSRFGKHRLFERISPKKSWEGSIGGGIIAIGVALLISFYFKELSMINWLVMAFIIVVAGTYGDLVESLFKRSIGVKDSGTLLPGHGGILDRFDGLILSAPFVFIYLLLFAK